MPWGNGVTSPEIHKLCYATVTRFDFNRHQSALMVDLSEFSHFKHGVETARKCRQVRSVFSLIRPSELTLFYAGFISVDLIKSDRLSSFVMNEDSQPKLISIRDTWSAYWVQHGTWQLLLSSTSVKTLLTTFFISEFFVCNLEEKKFIWATKKSFLVPWRKTVRTSFVVFFINIHSSFYCHISLNLVIFGFLSFSVTGNWISLCHVGLWGILIHIFQSINWLNNKINGSLICIENKHWQQPQ